MHEVLDLGVIVLLQRLRKAGLLSGVDPSLHSVQVLMRQDKQVLKEAHPKTKGDAYKRLQYAVVRNEEGGAGVQFKHVIPGAGMRSSATNLAWFDNHVADTYPNVSGKVREELLNLLQLSQQYLLLEPAREKDKPLIQKD